MGNMPEILELGKLRLEHSFHGQPELLGQSRLQSKTRTQKEHTHKSYIHTMHVNV